MGKQVKRSSLLHTNPQDSQTSQNPSYSENLDSQIAKIPKIPQIRRIQIKVVI
ncbi:hypothetical protein [Helicobacter sp. 16-1353]|uniref:hypothetical protein n=1 Tax=Helicobacter sp. 16-1353 TaxID=2004996 RepID=UPI0015EF4EE6|nr:hypothetical protein [Helicobacter sp. 16-1353]